MRQLVKKLILQEVTKLVDLKHTFLNDAVKFILDRISTLAAVSNSSAGPISSGIQTSSASLGGQR